MNMEKGGELEIGREKESDDKKVIVEIGPGASPISKLSEEAKEQIRDGAEYIGIDCDQEELEKFKRGEIDKAIRADFASLPFKNNSVDEIWLLNVFGNLKNIPMRQDDKLVFILNRGRYFKEFSRVIKKNGEVFIGEIYFPVRGKDKSWIAQKDYSEFRFDKKVYIDDGLKEFVAEHQIEDSFIEKDFGTAKNPFFMVLKKR